MRQFPGETDGAHDAPSFLGRIGWAGQVNPTRGVRLRALFDRNDRMG